MGLVAELDAAGDGVLGTYAEDVETFKGEYELLKREFTRSTEGYGQRLQGLWQAIRDDLRWQMPSLEAYPVPEAVEAEELGDGLYNNLRDYLDQGLAYKEVQGKLEEKE